MSEAIGATRRELLIAMGAALAANGAAFVSKRPPKSQRKFVSPAVEETISRIKGSIGDPKLAWLFENCFPNTLDTTVDYSEPGGKPDTFVITGDIDAMWLRDSSAQVWPYLPLVKKDAALQKLMAGIIRRQARCILLDPYANAFLRSADAKPLPWSLHDETDKKPGVGERKWEIDSLCYPIRLAHGYWQATGDTSPFDAEWRRAMETVVDTFVTQQRKHDRGPYHFQREAKNPTDTLPLSGYGNPTRPNGMIHSMFRPSDDACIYPLFVPANLFAVVSLRQLAQMSDGALQSRAVALAGEVETAVRRDGRITAPDGDYWAYEIDGFGNKLFMDDANVPSLLALPYLGACSKDDALYRRTRRRVLSQDNPYFFSGPIAEGVGGPHVGLGMIWPMSIIIRALTSSDNAEIRSCLAMLRNTDADTGFMHESFRVDNPKDFTRSWFAWANTLFGELVLRTAANSDV